MVMTSVNSGQVWHRNVVPQQYDVRLSGAGPCYTYRHIIPFNGSAFNGLSDLERQAMHISGQDYEGVLATAVYGWVALHYDHYCGPIEPLTVFMELNEYVFDETPNIEWEHWQALSALAERVYVYLRPTLDTLIGHYRNVESVQLTQMIGTDFLVEVQLEP